MKTKIYLTLILISLFFSVSQTAKAQWPSWLWAKKMGGSSLDAPYSVLTDASGNVYTTGGFNSIADFDPGTGAYTLTWAGGSDVFVAKLDGNGNFVWAKRFGDSGGDIAMSSTLDAAGNIYITGYFVGQVDFDPGPGVFNITASNYGNTFICKLDSSGNFVWAKAFVISTQSNQGQSIITDTAGNVYTVGIYIGTLDFDPGPGIFNLTALNSDTYISKLDSSGNFIWAKSMGGSLGYTQIQAITVIGAGDIYGAGYFSETTDFNPGAGTFNLISSGLVDAFIFKLDSSGNFGWANSFGNVDSDLIQSVCVDNKNNVYVTGSFEGTVDFDPGIGVVNLTAAGDSDIFIVKFNSTGNFIWAKTMGGTNNEYGYSVTSNFAGNIYVSGNFQGTADFDPGVGVFNLTSAGMNDVFVLSLDSNGNFIWAARIGGLKDEFSYSIVPDIWGNGYVAGFFTSSTITIGATTLTNVGSTGTCDIFISRLSFCTTSATINVNACNSYNSPSGNYAWTTSGIYYDTIPNGAGCDSIITINLTINTTSSSSQTISTCASYTSPSGNYIWTTSGVYNDTIPNSTGCDSIITVNLTINPLPVVLYTLYPDTTTPHNWYALNQCTGTPPLTYAWNWGDGSQLTIGATPTHVYADSGYYNICVTVTDGPGCSSTYCDSSTYIYKGNSNSMITLSVVTSLPTGIENIDGTSLVTLYPNPATNHLTISLPKISQKVNVVITDITGKAVYNIADASTQKLEVNTKDFSDGVYFVQIQTADFVETRKLIIQK